MMSKFQRILRSLRFMVGKYEPLKRPTFLTDPELEIRRAAARDLIGDRPIPRLIESQPDYGEPVDFDRLPNG